MSKPVRDVTVSTMDERSASLKAVFDTGSFNTIVREDRLPAGATIERRLTPLEFRTAAQGGKLRVTGVVVLTISIEDKLIQDDALVSPDLAQDMLIGAKTMQAWDITVQNQNGQTKIIVGHDMRDPDIIGVD